ncbi:Rv1535 domain-containing protein [Mycobacterium sp.]|uniref:Rv1535 domain-containing protein n=1 Tax=Mycobacterium sp. TaxID=1785 RepID=UPI0039C90D6E
MWTTGGPDDLLISATGRLLTVPTSDLYALLWRAGVLELLETNPAPADRAPGGHPSRLAPSPADHPTGESWRPPRPWRPQRIPAPAPSPAGQRAYTRATD